MGFKDKLKVVRKRLFITQEQLGNELGCKRQAVNRWEDGTTLPSLILGAKFEKFCEGKILSSKNIKLNISKM